MKSRQTAALAARVLVGAVLVFAGAPKATAPVEQFAFVIQAYDVIPSSMTLPMAALLPWLEILLGWALILGVSARGAAAAAGGLFGMFLLALGSSIARGIALPSCGCFGGDIHLTPAQAFFLDTGMIALCWLAIREGAGPLSLDAWSDLGL